MADRRRFLLLLVLAGEALAFGLGVDRFATLANAFEIVRAATELGLLALAMTLVMQSGGIDLSVGSVLALSAVALGACHRAGAPMLLAVLAALATGLVCGVVNGALITRRNIPPLLATLATMALFRGIAEGTTGGHATFTGFPHGFLFLGQGAVLGVPMQLPILLLAAAATWLCAHRTVFGRRVTALGYSPEGARHAGIDVSNHRLTVHALCGLAAGAAGVLYSAHLGQAKADAGTGFELAAITVVALGGTPVTGGAASVPGTLLALLCLAVLQNGLLLAGQPGELVLVLQGVLLVLAVAPQGLHAATAPTSAPSSGLDMKNSQVAVICATILFAAAIVSWTLVHLFAREADPQPGATPAQRVAVAMMPKNKSDPYFASCREGATAAAQELGVDLLWEGPNDTDAARQNELVEAWIQKRVDVIAVSVENQAAISTVLRKARRAGIQVLTWDADAETDARDVFINQATEEAIGFALTDEAGRILGGKGRFAIVSATVTAANQNAWLGHIQARLKDRWPGLELVTTRYSDGLRDKALTETKNLLRAFPDVQLVMAIAAAAVPGAAEAVKQEGSKARVIGLSVPSLCRDYVHQGVIESITLWNTVDLGYLTVHAARALHDGRLAPGRTTTLRAGRLGSLEVRGDQVLLGTPFRFTKDNIDQFKF